MFRVALLFLALTVAFTWPLTMQLGTHLAGAGTDPDLYMWTLGWTAHALLHQPWAIFDANIFYPARVSLAFSENLIGSGLLVAPWIWIAGDLVSASNLIQLSSVWLSALGVYLLGRRLGLSTAAAILAGVVFGFTPARLMRMTQVHVTTVQWMPFCLAYLHTYFSPNGRPRDLKWAAAFFAAQALTSGHGAAFLTVAVVVVLSYRIVLGEPVALRRWLSDLGVPGILAAGTTLVLVVPYRQARQEVASLERLADDAASTFSSYLSSPSHLHDWVWNRLPEWLTTPGPEAHLFPGVMPLLLAAAAVVGWRARETGPARGISMRARLRDNPVVVYALLAIVAFWLTLGTPWGLWRVARWLPAFTFIRVPSRFALVEFMAIGVLAGFGFDYLTRRWPPRRTRLAAAATALLLAVEFAAMPLETRATHVDVPAADRWLARQATPFVVAEAPVPDSLSAVTQSLRETMFMLHATAHWQKTVHGYSGVDTGAHIAIRNALTRFPDEDSLRLLTDYGVTWVIVHPQLYPESERADAEARLAAHADRLTLAFSSVDGRVYRLEPVRAASGVPAPPR